MHRKRKPPVNEPPPPPWPLPAGRWARALLGWPAVAVVLLAFWALMVWSVAGKCSTADEIVHLTAGVSYWKFNDYRIDPENGNLPQRVMALPVVLRGCRFPSVQQGETARLWQNSEEWRLGEQFFYHCGNDVGSMLLWGRAASALFAVLLGLLVYAMARRLFGAGGGMIALLLFVLNPTVLANGPLMTSDMAGAFFLLASAWAVWAMSQRVTPRTVLLSAAAMAGMFLSKMSGPVVVLVGVVLMAVRLIPARPLPVRLPWLRRDVGGRAGQAGVMALALLVHGAVVILAIWAFYGLATRWSAPSAPSRSRRPSRGTS